MPPQAGLPARPSARHMSSSERGGWRLFGRLLIWATRNGIAGKDDS
jgi:hypothetical protein